MAHRLLGTVYADGYHVADDPFAALVHLERAYADGDAEAAYRLAFLYGAKTGVGLDETRAQDYLLKAAEQGVPHALYYAGRNYYYGFWTAPDAEKADYGGEAKGFILLADYYIEREQWERAHGYGTLAMQIGDQEVKNLARRVFEAVEPHLKRPQPPSAGTTAGLG